MSLLLFLLSLLLMLSLVSVVVILFIAGFPIGVSALVLAALLVVVRWALWLRSWWWRCVRVEEFVDVPLP